jgi:hypothetical protein
LGDLLAKRELVVSLLTSAKLTKTITEDLARPAEDRAHYQQVDHDVFYWVAPLKWASRPGRIQKARG